MNMKPIAWMDKDTGQVSRVACYDIPLYTHPVKELTDEEILVIAYEILEVWNTKEALVDFAKAILRKAQEK